MCINLCLVNWYALFNVFLLVVFLTLGVQSHERKKKPNKQKQEQGKSIGTTKMSRAYEKKVQFLFKFSKKLRCVG